MAQTMRVLTLASQIAGGLFSVLTYDLCPGGRALYIQNTGFADFGLARCLLCLRHEHLPNVACPIGDWFPGLASQNHTPPWNMCIGMNVFLAVLEVCRF